MRRVWLMLGLVCLPSLVGARVDTLRDTSEVYDAIIYGWRDCNSEITGENCLRYNGGAVAHMGVGKTAEDRESRVVFRLEGYGDSLPDSSEFLVYCHVEADTADRRVFLYPLLRQFFEGSENNYNLGDYPQPDSGVTWEHAYLDDGDRDSVCWSNPGGDYDSAYVCTTRVTGEGQWFVFKGFNRILNYWDSTGEAYGFILVNENAEPETTSRKTIKSSETGTMYAPMLLMYFADPPAFTSRRRRLIEEELCSSY